MNFLTLCMVMVCMVEGKKLIIKTNKKNYLARQKGNKHANLRNSETDYNDEPAWLNPCSLRERGDMKQPDVRGCGGGINLKCTGGCLEIYKTLYSCKQENVSNENQLKKVRSLCDKKQSCRLEASRDFFGNTECPGAPDRKMALWVAYSCNEGEDKTKLTGPETCPYYENVRIRLIARNSQNNNPVPGATGSVNFQGDDGLTVVADEVAFNGGELLVPVSANGKYTGQIKADGFITADFEIEVACSADNCQVDKLVTLSPVLPPEKTRIMLTWEKAKPSDVDIHVMAVKKSDGSMCKTMWSNKNSCKSVSLDLDNTKGGLNGAETVTLLDNTINKDYRYLVGINDYKFEDGGVPFLNSGSSITVTNGIQNVMKRLQGSGLITRANK